MNYLSWLRTLLRTIEQIGLKCSEGSECKNRFSKIFNNFPTVKIPNIFRIDFLIILWFRKTNFLNNIGCLKDFSKDFILSLKDMISWKYKFLKDLILFKILSIFTVIIEIKSLLFHGYISRHFSSLQVRFFKGFHNWSSSKIAFLSLNFSVRKTFKVCA